MSPGKDSSEPSRSATLLAAGLFALEEEPPEEHPLDRGGHVLHPLSRLHILVAVDVGVDLQADEAEPEAVEIVVPEFRGLAVDGLEQEGELLELFECLDDPREDREALPPAGKNPRVINITPRSGLPEPA